MDSVEALVTEMRGLTPHQLHRVAAFVHEIKSKHSAPPMAPPSVLPQALINRAVSNGWPIEIFTEVIGQMDDDFARPTQPPFTARTR